MQKSAYTTKNKQAKSELDKFKLFYEHISTDKSPVSDHLRTAKRPRRFGF